MNKNFLLIAIGTISFFLFSCKKNIDSSRPQLCKLHRDASDAVSVVEGRLYFPDMETFSRYIDHWNAIEKCQVLDEQRTLGFMSYENYWEQILAAYEDMGKRDASGEEVNRFARDNASFITITNEDFEGTVPDFFRTVCNSRGEFQIGDYVYFVDNRRCITMPLVNYNQLELAKEFPADIAHYVDFNCTAKYIPGNDIYIWSTDWLGFENRTIRSNYRATIKIYANWYGMWDPYKNQTYEYRNFTVFMKAQKKGWTGIWYANPQTFNFTYIWYLANWGYNDLISKNNIYTSNNSFVLCSYSGILSGDKRIIKDYYHYLCSQGLACPDGHLIISGNVESTVYF